MRLVFVFRNEPGMASQADMMLRIEGVNRARSPAIRTAFPLSAEKQMPRDSDGCKEQRIDVEAIRPRRMMIIHDGFIFSRVPYDETADQGRQKDGQAKGDSSAAGLFHFCQSGRRNGIRSDDLPFAVRKSHRAGDRAGVNI